MLLRFTLLDSGGGKTENRGMAGVVFEKVSKHFAGPHHEQVGAVRDLNLTVADGELLVIVGPSGCGKTTTLRLLAGLETPDSGTISLGSKSLAGVPPKDRDVAMMFQHHALLPHLTVFENMAFGLMLRKFPRAEIIERVQKAAGTLNLTALLDRRPGELSGGECQRVALGRSLVRQPKVFLFDEPLSNLDAPMRLQLRGEIAAVCRRAGATMIYVTHDQAEAMALADRVAVMRDGAVQQAASPLELYQHPANQFVAGFIGAPPMNFFSGTVEKRIFRSDGWELPMNGVPAMEQKAVVLGLRPEHVTLAANGKTDGRIEATVERIETTGAESLVYLWKGGSRFVARAPASFSAKTGQGVAVLLEMERAHFFDAATGALCQHEERH
jgi:multiple sugar transport system ATP-binding protein